MEVELEKGEDDGSEVDMTAAMDEWWRRFRSLDVVGKRALRSRVIHEDVVNVESDGNCGFRVIASLHGYGEDGWSMVRRELGLELIDKDRSTLYDKLFSNRLSAAIRASLSFDDKFTFTKCLYLLHWFVNQNHWVQVNMKEGFPLPPVTLDWKKFRSHIATTWMLGFAGRMQHWQTYTCISMIM
ncbi:hypothetical protein KIW84_UN0887 [Lathyrus oleraceus]|nr:hypothetical protein KIW84_UN0887 [Pisum sativum]